MDKTSIREELNEGIKRKPEDFIVSDLKWKFLIRNILRGENIFLVGPTGCGKTSVAIRAANALNRKFFKIPLGSTQDARASLVGNTSLKKEIGTIFHKSLFVNAITTPNSVVILDELSRLTHDGMNILIPVLDPIQRCLRLDENEEGNIINVADGVCFIATANIGSEYTSTKVLDKAMSARFSTKIEMDPLNSEQLKYLFNTQLFPKANQSERNIINQIISISEDIYSEFTKEDANIETFLSTRSLIKMGELVMDGFTLLEIAEVGIYPEFSTDSGMEQSERIFVKMIVQKYIETTNNSPIKDPRRK